MSIKSINEAFKRLYESEINIETTEDEFSELEITLRNTVDSLIDNNEFHIKKFEIALQDVLENYFPEQSWWEVTNVNIFMDLFEQRDPYGTVDRILKDLRGETDEVEESLNEARNFDNIEINAKIAKALSRKSFAKKYEKELNDLGITVNYLDGQGTSLTGPNGRRLSSSRKEIYGPSAPGHNGTHNSGYVTDTKWEERRVERAKEKVNELQSMLDTLDVSALSQRYPNKSVEDAIASLRADFNEAKIDLENYTERLKREIRNRESALAHRHANRKLGHEQPYLRDTTVDANVQESPIDYLTYLTKEPTGGRDELPEYTPRITKYKELEDNINRAENNLATDKRWYNVLEADAIQQQIDDLELEFQKRVEELLRTQENNKSRIQNSFDRVERTKKEKSDYMKSLGIGN